MAWIEYHEALRDHWKIHRLAERLGIEYPHALGCLSSLWLWSVSNAQKGDLKVFTNGEISRAMMLKDAPKDLKKVLQDCELLDENGLIHDWKKHGISLLESNRKRQKKFRDSKRYSNVTLTSPSRPTDQPNQPTKPTKPTIEDLRAYFREKGSTQTEADKFFHFYESNGWKVGKNPMRKWRSAASGWISRAGDFSKQAPVKKPAIRRCWVCTADIPEAEFTAHFKKHEAERDRSENSPQSAGSIIQNLAQKKEATA